MVNIGVLGAGTWGLALARMLSVFGHKVEVWSALKEEIESLSKTHAQKNLPGVKIPEEIVFTVDLKKACENKDIIVMAVPSIYVRNTAKSACPFIKKGQIIVDVAKGIEPSSLLSMTEVIASEIPQCIPVALSGPTHAEEVARDLPTTIVSACENAEVAEYVQSVFSNNVMRVYTNVDVKGVELCGALKNVIAIACGISAGLGFGDNTVAALITRGLAEITRLGLRMGCLPDTFAGLAGMGDLIVTATSRHSRNNKFGHLIGQGYNKEDALKEVGMVVEGLNALPAALELERKYHVEMPIVNAVDQIINFGASPKDAVTTLMNRDKTSEINAHRK